MRSEEKICQPSRPRYLICVGVWPTAGAPSSRAPQLRVYAEFSVPLYPLTADLGVTTVWRREKPGGMWGGSIVAVLANVKLYTGTAGKKGRAHPGIDLILGKLNRPGRDR